MKKFVSVLLVLMMALSCAAMLTACSAGNASGSAELTGSYCADKSYIWFDEYQKNLVGVQHQTLSLFGNGTYVLTCDNQCIANMDNEVVTNAPYDPFYSSRLVVTGKYETVSEPDDFGTMEVKLVDGTVNSVNGNFEGVWPMDNDGERNFDLTIDNTSVTIDTTTLQISDIISIFSIKEG